VFTPLNISNFFQYMAMIIQARNSSNGGQTSEVLRRQVAMLHLRFYVALLGTFIVACYAGEKYRLAYGLTLYSFWIPQIAYNVYTEAKAPLHKHYIYGMSVTRLVAPLYILAVPNNFLKEVYPDAPTDPWLCQLLVLWVGIQVAVLMAQGKYGARFMIPARFLPPKFDYSRPLPPSMLPPGVLQSATKPTMSEMMDDRHCSSTSNKRDESTHGSNAGTPASSLSQSASSTTDSTALLSRHNATAMTTRNRIRGKRSATTREALVAESPSPTTGTASISAGTIVVDSGSGSGTTVAAGDHHLAASHTLDCSICYDAIDVHDRRQYMLAPCDHLFHRDCLLRWMDQKMECPTCRCQLPTA
jgi:transmembrane E3 ubiquitin-protein ligase